MARLSGIEAIERGWAGALAAAQCADLGAEAPSCPVYLTRGHRRVRPDAFPAPEDAAEYVRGLYGTARLSKDRSTVVASHSQGGPRFVEHFTLRPAPQCRCGPAR